MASEELHPELVELELSWSGSVNQGGLSGSNHERLVWYSCPARELWHNISVNMSACYRGFVWRQDERVAGG